MGESMGCVIPYHRQPFALPESFILHGEAENPPSAAKMMFPETVYIGNLNEMFRGYLCPPFDFAALRSGRAVSVPVRAERNPQGEVEAWTALGTNDLGNL